MNTGTILVHARKKLASIWTGERWSPSFFSAYYRGVKEPNYPLPTVIEAAVLDNGMAYISMVDPWKRCAPVVTWYNEAWGLPMPEDHGVADYSLDFIMAEIYSRVKHP